MEPYGLSAYGLLDLRSMKGWCGVLEHSMANAELVLAYKNSFRMVARH